jgi:hypothetical protein
MAFVKYNDLPLSDQHRAQELAAVERYLNFVKDSTANTIKMTEMLVAANKVPELGYGSILVGGDYAGDLEAIAKLLNEWKWDSDGNVEFVVDGDHLSPTVARVCDPTVHPDRLRVLGGATGKQYKRYNISATWRRNGDMKIGNIQMKMNIPNIRMIWVIMV